MMAIHRHLKSVSLEYRLSVALFLAATFFALGYTGHAHAFDLQFSGFHHKSTVTQSPLAQTKETQAKETKTKQILMPAPSAGWAEARNAGAVSKLSVRFPDQTWWTSFNDPQLTRYIEVALQNNPGIQIAALHISEARALVQQNIAKELPAVSVNPGFTRVALPDLGVSALPGILKFYNLPLQASYEVDLFGKNWDTIQASRAEVKATEADSKSATTSIIAEVAAAYINLLQTDTRLQKQQENLTLLQKIADLQTSLNASGLTSEEEVIRARQALATAQTDLNEARHQQAVYAHQLAILTGSTPGDATQIARRTLDNLVLPEETAIGLPGELLTRRPDIQATEQRLASEKLNVRAARKAFLPTISLSTMLGFGGSHPGNLLTRNNWFDLLSASAAQPIFQGGKLKGNLHYHQAKQKEALEQYRQVILNAFKDVEDSLSALSSSYDNLIQQQARLDLATHHVSLTESRYQQGLESKLALLQAQSEQNSDAQQLAMRKANTAVATISLYKALGGGF